MRPPPLARTAGRVLLTYVAASTKRLLTHTPSLPPLLLIRTLLLSIPPPCPLFSYSTPIPNSPHPPSHSLPFPSHPLLSLQSPPHSLPLPPSPLLS